MQYILDITLTWSILYIVFYAFFRKVTFFRINRWYLLSAVTLGILLPLLRHVDLGIDQRRIAEAAPLFLILKDSSTMLAESVDQLQPSFYDILYIAFSLIYVAGVFFFTLRLSAGLWNIYSIYRNADKEKKEYWTLVHS